jgi:hypothetical protein
MIEDIVNRQYNKRETQFLQRLEQLEQELKANKGLHNADLTYGDQNLEFDPELFTPRTKLQNAKQVRVASKPN